MARACLEIDRQPGQHDNSCILRRILLILMEWNLSRIYLESVLVLDFSASTLQVQYCLLKLITSILQFTSKTYL